MKIRLDAGVVGSLLAAVLFMTDTEVQAAQCNTCHSGEYNLWSASPHAATQQDIAWELSHLHVGRTPGAVITGEDCIACHSPTAGSVNGGMNDTDSLAHFFTTSNGVFTTATVATNTSAWPHVSCTACHNVRQPHEFIASTLAIFESRTGQYIEMPNSSQLCGQCHGDLRFPGSDQLFFNHWSASRHAHSQTNVASGLARDWIGHTPTEVISGTNSDNCIACHSPTAVLVRGGDEALALGSFFSTVNGQFTSNTVAVNPAQWPSIGCTACHDPHAAGKLAYFNSSEQRYQAMTNSTQLCGQCHGNLRFPDTDQRLYNAWTASRHANSQTNVANGLRAAHAGETPDEVIHGPDGRNCIACHAPTSVLEVGGDEVQALNYFFTSTNGQFFSGTVATHTNQWPGITCKACHDTHNLGQVSYFNSSSKSYQVMTNGNQLCGQCHGDLRFADSPYSSYNIEAGTGGIGVSDQQVMPGVSCADCHMYASKVDGSHSKSFGGHSWANSVAEAGGQVTLSCLGCHDGATVEGAEWIINGWKAEFRILEASVLTNVARVSAAVQNSQSATARAALAEAQFNLSLAERDESGGFHNHTYLMALLRAADQKASAISLLSASTAGANIRISWIGPGTLQTADALTGPWHDVPNATNPLIVAPAPGPQSRFFRLRP